MSRLISDTIAPRDRVKQASWPVNVVRSGAYSSVGRATDF